MIALLTEEDFVELPEEAAHKWIHLEKIAHSRLLPSLDNLDTADGAQLKTHYMNLAVKLAVKYGVSGVTIPNENTTNKQYDSLRLMVTVAQAVIWADSSATFPFGRVAISQGTRAIILGLTSEIEAQIESLDISQRRREALHKCIEDFRREINQPKTRVATAISSLAQATTFVLGVTTSLIVTDAYTKISGLLAAEQIAQSTPDVALIEEEKQLLLAPPPKLIEDHTSKD